MGWKFELKSALARPLCTYVTQIREAAQLKVV
jgi:hypothetical protein